ncbi:serine hydrolase domain-containing protein [Frankia sp. Cas4]|uniref:serine hydrolase domain-containing protein n=1 Tax=Frankia sp. Cas4 TaxID=3073927 RepID=UPI002AD38E91|nr:serine hydrolase domain-containing protein [Frankia sp. Cas4]
MCADRRERGTTVSGSSSPVALLADPVDVGLDPRRLALLTERVRIEVEGGPLPSAQIALARAGRLVLFETYGDATPQTRYVLQSASRPIVASIVWKLMGEGLLAAGERVADIIPEFGTNGKDVVTVEQVLTHTAGFPLAPLGWPQMLDRGQRLAAMSKWRLTFEPGSRLEFHLTSAAWVIAEIVERRTGSTLAQYLREEIAEPLGLSLELGVPQERHADDVAPFVSIDPPDTGATVDPWGPWYLSKPEILAAGEPSHSLVGTARDVALHYQSLFHSGRWTPTAVTDGIRPRLTMHPQGYSAQPNPVTMGLFVVVAGTLPGAYLPATGSAETFGHGGAPCQVSFMDPVSQVSFAFLTNGYPLSGYDESPRGVARRTNIANLAADVLADASADAVADRP